MPPTTPNMGLTLPTPSVTPGPLYATENNTAFTTIDSHNHTTGQGVPVPSAGININADLAFNNNNAVNLRTTQFFNNPSALGTPSDLRCVYSVLGEMFYNDGVGNQIQLTIGGALNATTVGGIGGDYSTSTASVFYTSVDQTFTFTQAIGINATLDIGTLILRNEIPSSFGLTLNPPAAMIADETITLPLVPSVTSFVTMDNTGAMLTNVSPDNVTIGITGPNLSVLTNGINTPQLAPNSVDQSKRTLRGLVGTTPGDIVYSGNSGAYSTFSTTDTLVVSCATLTTIGNPVSVTFTSTNTSVQQLYSTTSATISLYVNGSPFYRWIIGGSSVPTLSVNTALVAGSYTFAIYVKQNSPGTANVAQMALSAYEIF